MNQTIYTTEILPQVEKDLQGFVLEEDNILDIQVAEQQNGSWIMELSIISMLQNHQISHQLRMYGGH